MARKWVGPACVAIERLPRGGFVVRVQGDSLRGGSELTPSFACDSVDEAMAFARESIAVKPDEDEA